MISPDPRLRAISVLLVPAFVGHFVQLASEDVPWAPWALERYYTTPGWHLYIAPLAIAVIAAALAAAVIGLAVRRTRPWLVAVIALYVLHYFTYPFRIRNHMTTMLSELVVLGGVWLVGRRSDRRLVDHHAVTGMGAVLVVVYFFAALHKMNDRFLSFGEQSSAVDGLTTFMIYGDLGSVPPAWARALATWGTVAIEGLAPVVAWRVPRLRFGAITALILFHFPQVAVMNVADYPMIASAFYPALFPARHLRALLAHAGPNRFTLAGAAIGVSAQMWFMPYVGPLMIFGGLVSALWGWVIGAMLRAARSV